eukprot:CAMPEP_0171812310 /NCGR_PEP_ID=MMETSP0991-20121206/78616_1 /TAXON_ID=483369 /ORGANISM="non described non described, Strain CCMP2098" /LENGTH=91 /DNA_ID=CAMNT_0012425821 /DNA_START=190 /DNA_END=462 /DNA_ORIENTATION=-
MCRVDCVLQICNGGKRTFALHQTRQRLQREGASSLPSSTSAPTEGCTAVSVSAAAAAPPRPGTSSAAAVSINSTGAAAPPAPPPPPPPPLP